MKRIFTVLAIMATVSLASAQNAPKTAPKAETKKECKKGGKCCSKESKTETASAETVNKSAKKN